jgi:hypothetical protein
MKIEEVKRVEVVFDERETEALDIVYDILDKLLYNRPMSDKEILCSHTRYINKADIITTINHIAFLMSDEVLTIEEEKE